jgi:uncharacterized protein (DUF1501 family)
MPTRREMLHLMAALGAGVATGVGLPRLAFANGPGEARLVVLFLTGGLDGLSAVPAHGDPDYRRIRGELALPPPDTPGGIVDLDGFYGLNPALGPLHELYARGEFAALHAVASPARILSHFEAMDILQNGMTAAHAARDGWLNRALRHYGDFGGRFALGVVDLPEALQGDLMVGQWSPGAFQVEPGLLDLAQGLLGADPVLGPAFVEGRRIEAVARSLLPPGKSLAIAPAFDPSGLPVALAITGTLLADPRGPRIAALTAGGYDSHGGQEGPGGMLHDNLPPVAAGIRALERQLGAAWRHTILVAVTEFGRAVVPNGSSGTDHGTAGVALLAGGAIKGGRVIADWPGIRADRLHEGRDLAPTRDLRGLFKAVLRDHLGMPEGFLEDRVFPDSRAAAPLDGLFRVAAARI